MNEQTIAEARAKVTQYKVSQNFNKKHGDKGGIAQLERMINNHDTLDAISQWFGLSKSRVSVILQDYLGMSYTAFLSSRKITRQGVNHE